MDGQPLSALRDLFGERLFTSREQRICYSYDATGTMSLPDAVAFPVSAEEGRPGVVDADLEEAAKKRGLFSPPDPASLKFCTIGGNIAECSGGMCAVKYGVTRDYVMGLEAVLGTGGLIRARIPPCAMELMDRTAIDCVREEADLPVPDDAGCALLIEVDGPRESVSTEADRGEQACRQDGAIEVGRARDGEGRRADEAVSEIFGKPVALGGTISGEHGIGNAKAPFLEMEVGPLGVSVMKRLKNCFDPNGILTPGETFVEERVAQGVVAS